MNGSAERVAEGSITCETRVGKGNSDTESGSERRGNGRKGCRRQGRCNRGTEDEGVEGEAEGDAVVRREARVRVGMREGTREQEVSGRGGDQRVGYMRRVGDRRIRKPVTGREQLLPYHEAWKPRGPHTSHAPHHLGRDHNAASICR